MKIIMNARLVLKDLLLMLLKVLVQFLVPTSMRVAHLVMLLLVMNAQMDGCLVKIKRLVLLD